MKILKYIIIVLIWTINIHAKKIEKVTIAEQLKHEIIEKQKTLQIYKKVKNIFLIFTISGCLFLIHIFITKKYKIKKAAKPRFLIGKYEESMRISKELHDNITSCLNILSQNTCSIKSKNDLKRINLGIQKLSHRLNIRQIMKAKFKDILLDFIPTSLHDNNNILNVIMAEDFTIKDTDIKISFLNIIHQLLSYQRNNTELENKITLRIYKKKKKHILEYINKEEKLDKNTEEYKKVKKIIKQIRGKIQILNSNKMSTYIIVEM